MAFLFARPRHPRVFKERHTPTESYYRTQYRFNEPTVQWIADVFLGPGSSETMGGALTNKQKMELFLRYVADPGMQNSVSEVAGVSQSSVSRLVKFVTEEIYRQADDWIKFPSTAAEINKAASDWQSKKRFPFCFGVVDGCLFKVKKPYRQHNPAEYYSGRKKFHCINAQISCDVNYVITSVCASWPGLA